MIFFVATIAWKSLMTVAAEAAIATLATKVVADAYDSVVSDVQEGGAA
ncbi:hypothetical protein [Comamonas badia]|nr:hypothetical protein [Comamonas badia]